MRRSLRVRLLVIVLCGIVFLASISALTSLWQLFRIRDRAIAGSSQALHQQADGYLDSLAQVRADGIGQTLGSVRQIADILKDYLTSAVQLDGTTATPDFQTTREGRRYSQGATTLVLPAAGEEQAVLAELAASQSLDLLLPSQARRVAEIVRISYISPLGSLRTFPTIALAALPADWSAETDPTYQLSLPRNNPLQTTVWSETHLAIDSSEQVLSAVSPVYRNNKFAGAIIVDISMSRLTGYLERLRIEQTGFAFLVDSAGHLVAAPESGQQQLVGRTITSAEQGKIELDRSIEGLEAALLDMRRSQPGVATITLASRPHLLSYAPIPTISWSQALIVPLDEITAGTKQTTEQITTIARDTQVIVLITSLLAVGLISAVMSLVLRRQFAQPLASLISATQSVAAGELQPIVSKGEDEIGQLAASFNLMTSSLKESRDEILGANQRLEQTVRERTRDLRTALQLAEDANRLKTQFLANMSHELRTPLNAILNFTEMLSLERFGGPFTDQQQALQGRILTNAEHLLGLINDILDLSKIEAGRMDLVYEQVDLTPMLKGVMSTAIGLTSGKGLELTLDIADELPEVRIDKTRIRQVLLNLLSNAAKFTEEGEITVRVYPCNAEFICVEVRDTGIGISSEHQALVFEEFRQVQSDMMRQYQGTGLGLPISKRLVEMHGGRMWLDSTVGAGSTFAFTIPIAPKVLPVEKPPSLEPDDADLSLLETQAPAAGALVMVIDDDSNAQHILRWYLEEAGYRVQAILDSREALSALREHQPSLVILDINMPHVTGWEILATIKGAPDLASIPVLLCTVFDQQRLGMLAGANGYVTKPVRQDALMPQVERWTSPRSSILVVDDDADTRQIMRSILTEAHYQVREATNGVEGLALIEGDAPALVILDLMMPMMDGFAFLAHLRTHPATANLPVIVVTARDLNEQEREWLIENTQHYINKSQFTIHELIGHVQEVLEHAPS